MVMFNLGLACKVNSGERLVLGSQGCAKACSFCAYRLPFINSLCSITLPSTSAAQHG